MATVTGLTAARMAEIEDASIVSGEIVGDDLILHTFGGDDVNAGDVRGPIGPSGSGFVICTSSTRPSLSSGDAGTAIYETDTNLTYMWDGARWWVQPRIICTSSTRPTLVSDDEGAVIYETDTGYEYVWTGASFLSSVGSWPAGLVIPSFYATADEGFALLTGGTLSRTGVGLRLFNKWGTAFGVGNGTSTFTLPDFKGYTLAGVGGAISGALGSKSGATTHTLTTAQIPSHNHTQNQHRHAIAPNPANIAPFGIAQAGGDVGVGGGFDLTDYITPTNNPEGGGGSHPNVQPTALCNWQVSL